jgi:hypothetical protein
LPPTPGAFLEERDLGWLQFRSVLRSEDVEYFRNDSIRVKARPCVHGGWRIVVDEHVGQDHAPNFEIRAIQCADLGQELHDVRAEAADRPFLDSHQQFVFACETEDEIGVQRLGKTRIGDGGRNAVRRKNFGSLRALGKARAE